MPYNQKKKLEQVVAIGSLIGEANTVFLYILLGGRQIYFPTVKNITRALKTRELVQEIKRQGAKRHIRHRGEVIRLAKKYDMPPITIYKIMERYKRLLKEYPNTKII